MSNESRGWKRWVAAGRAKRSAPVFLGLMILAAAAGMGVWPQGEGIATGKASGRAQGRANGQAFGQSNGQASGQSNGQASGQSNGQAGARASRVLVAVAAPSAAPRSIEFPGVLQASGRAGLAFPSPGRVAERRVEVGDSLRRGEPVARLDAREYRLAEQQAAAALAEVETRLGQAGRDRARVEALHMQRAATREELEQVIAACEALAAVRDAAVARHDDAIRLVEDATLRAPFDGVITAVHIDAGEWVAPGRPVAEIAGGGGLELEIQVTESIRGCLEAGASVEVGLPRAGLKREGRIERVSAAAPGPGSLYLVKIAVRDGAGLVPGQSATARLQLPAEPGVEIPLSAVLNPGASRPSVFRVRGGKAERIWIVPGALNDGRIVIRDGLAAGDSVVVAGHGTLVDGDPVVCAASNGTEVR